MNLEALVSRLWCLLFLPLFLLCSISILLRCRLLPLRKLPVALRLPFCGEGSDKGQMTAGQAASAALAATVGTGNIIGTAQALAMGGPGAAFWLWTAALLGFGVKYAEILLGLRGHRGAMGYLCDALGRRWAGFYAAAAAGGAILVGNMAQMNGAASALRALSGREDRLATLLLALALTLFVAFALSGGAVFVGRITARLVPGMAGLYVGVLVLVLLCHGDRVQPALEQIVQEAFHPRAALGAAGGAALRQSVVWGLRRGIFSNEAGLGTAANIHAEAAEGTAPVHALWGVFEVFADTVVICTLTALVLLTCGVPIPYGTLPGPELLENAVSTVLGGRGAQLFLALALALFGLSTVIGCAVSGGRCARWLGGAKGERRYRAAYLLCAGLGCLLPVSLIWQAADAVNLILAVPNLVALLILAPEVGAASVELDFSKWK